VPSGQPFTQIAGRNTSRGRDTCFPFAPGGVLERRGHTEAAVDLARVAGFAPSGVICEVVNDDGTMARVPDLVRFCRKHGLTMITIADLVRYRLDSACEGGVEASDQRLRFRQREIA
jgi:3,4-dihydroxy-2-butanone 4-phosphate synthase